jgi:hypothetical protein
MVVLLEVAVNSKIIATAMTRITTEKYHHRSRLKSEITAKGIVPRNGSEYLEFGELSPFGREIYQLGRSTVLSKQTTASTKNIGAFGDFVMVSSFVEHYFYFLRFNAY